MITRILPTIFFVVGFFLFLAGQDTVPDENLIYRNKVKDQYNELLLAKDFKGAIDFLTEEIARQDIQSDESYFKNNGYFFAMRGLAYYKLYEYDLAKKDLNKGIKIVPEWPYGYYLRGLVKFNTKKYRAAYADYSKAIELDPGMKESYAARGNLFLWVRQYHDAIQDYNKYITLDSNSGVVFFKRGLATEYLLDYQGAVEDLKKAIELDPDPNYISHLGYLYYRQHDFDAAIDITLLGLKNDTSQTFFYQNLGRFYYGKGVYDEAYTNFSRCVESSPDNFRIPFNISMFYYGKDDLVNAKKFLDLAKELEPRLKKGMAGIREIDRGNAGGCKLASAKKTLHYMFEALE